MEAKDLLGKIIESLMELAQPVSFDFLMNYITGKETEAMEEQELTELETFGICQGEEEALLEVIIGEAIKKKLIKEDADNKSLTYTATGRKFQKKPKSFVVSYDDDDEEEEQDATIDSSINELMDEIVHEAPASKKGVTLTKKSSLKINLIHAIDNQKELDDLAESEGVDFDEILDEMESLIHAGTKIDINYFLNEVLEYDAIQELMELYRSNGGDLKAAQKEMEDVYNIEELRLVRIKYLCEHP